MEDMLDYARSEDKIVMFLLIKGKEKKIWRRGEMIPDIIPKLASKQVHIKKSTKFHVISTDLRSTLSR
jgi:hypothetical protein